MEIRLKIRLVISALDPFAIPDRIHRDSMVRHLMAPLVTMDRISDKTQEEDRPYADEDDREHG